MGSHPYEDVQVKCWSWGQTRPPDVARESCRNTSSEIVTASGKVNSLIQDAYLRNLAHSSFDGIRVSAYAENAPQLRVLQRGKVPVQLGRTTYNSILRLADLKLPRVRRKCFDEGRELLLSLPKLAESWFFKEFGATGESDGGRRMLSGHPGGHLSKDLVDHEGSVGHGGAGGGLGRSIVHATELTKRSRHHTDTQVIATRDHGIRPLVTRCLQHIALEYLVLYLAGPSAANPELGIRYSSRLQDYIAYFISQFSET